MKLSVGFADVAFGLSVNSGEAFLKKPERKGYAQLGPAIRIDTGSDVKIAVRKSDDALGITHKNQFSLRNSQSQWN